MATKTATAERVIGIDDHAVIGSDPSSTDDTTKSKTNKKTRKGIEKAVRELDKMLSHIHDVAHEFQDIQESLISTEVDPKDEARVVETVEILQSLETVLYHLVARMARKHVGKEIESIEGKKRKSLKK